MQFAVTFSGPLIVEAKDLANVLSLTSSAAKVEQYIAVEETAVPPTLEVPKEKGKPGRKPKSATPENVAGAGADGDGGSVSSGGAEKADDTAGSAGATAAPEPEVNAELLDRFTSLVDANYDGALQLLENFGVAKFSELGADKHPAFADALKALGV
jgi:hypothetical protein